MYGLLSAALRSESDDRAAVTAGEKLDVTWLASSLRSSAIGSRAPLPQGRTTQLLPLSDA